ECPDCILSEGGGVEPVGRLVRFGMIADSIASNNVGSIGANSSEGVVASRGQVDGGAGTQYGYPTQLPPTNQRIYAGSEMVGGERLPYGRRYPVVGDVDR